MLPSRHSVKLGWNPKITIPNTTNPVIWVRVDCIKESVTVALPSFSIKMNGEMYPYKSKTIDSQSASLTAYGFGFPQMPIETEIVFDASPITMRGLEDHPIELIWVELETVPVGE